MIWARRGSMSLSLGEHDAAGWGKGDSDILRGGWHAQGAFLKALPSIVTIRDGCLWGYEGVMPYLTERGPTSRVLVQRPKLCTGSQI